MNVITDQKRVARGEHLKLAKYYLQARDGVHNGKWKILMIAGPEPSGEAKAIRELMPNSWIICVDKENEYLTRVNGTADEILCCNLEPVQRMVTSQYGRQYKKTGPDPRLIERRPFDLIDLDLCGTLTRHSHVMLQVARALLSSYGILMVTFSYGRDVVPMFSEALKDVHSQRGGWPPIEEFLQAKIPTHIKARLVFLFRAVDLGKIRSVISYQGEHMPMCAVLLTWGYSKEIAFIKLLNEDFENVMLEQYGDGNPCRIYDCPAERLLFLRRSRSAKKAVATRRSIDKKQLLLFSMNGGKHFELTERRTNMPETPTQPDPNPEPEPPPPPEA